MKGPNPYAEFGLDRAAEKRDDGAWLEAAFEAAETRILPLWRAKTLIAPGEQPRAAMLSPEEARALTDHEAGENGAEAAERVFLGLKDGIAHFALDVTRIRDPRLAPVLRGRGEFINLRDVGALLPHDEGGLLAYAKGILHWHARHRFCGVCGTKTEMREGGHLRACLKPGCGTPHFPRTDPAVIMLVSRGDRAVLGRKSEWPDGMYSTLAGFVEPGESLEEAVVREVEEEVGIRAAKVRYHSSQPWPFPSSLMLGFHAEAQSDEIHMNPDELEDARWFTRAELAAGGAGIARRPRTDSIARRLIEEWIGDG